MASKIKWKEEKKDRGHRKRWPTDGTIPRECNAFDPQESLTHAAFRVTHRTQNLNEDSQRTPSV